MKNLLIALTMAIPAASASNTMPVAQQNAMVRTYCAGCHSDAKMVGGLTLENFDAARPDPGLMAMMASKINDGAMGAAGIKVTDRSLERDLLETLSAESKGADEWFVSRRQNPAAITASIVQVAPSPSKPEKPNLYRLKITCDVDTHKAEMQVAWAPGDVPGGSAVVSASADGKASLTYHVVTDDGAVLLTTPLPEQTLTVGNILANDKVVFPFGALAPAVRRELSTCFSVQ